MMKRFAPWLTVIAIACAFGYAFGQSLNNPNVIDAPTLFKHIFSWRTVHVPEAVTIAAQGDGGLGVYTLTSPNKSEYQFTCSDTDGCRITTGETGVRNGQILKYTNVGTNNVTFTEVAGVIEGTGSALVAGQWDNIEFKYAVSVFTETSRANN